MCDLDESPGKAETAVEAEEVKLRHLLTREAGAESTDGGPKQEEVTGKQFRSWFVNLIKGRPKIV